MFLIVIIILFSKAGFKTLAANKTDVDLLSVN